MNVALSGQNTVRNLIKSYYIWNEIDVLFTALPIFFFITKLILRAFSFFNLIKFLAAKIEKKSV